ncbi:hypothetical protein ADK70_26995 [Streptomyces rimosus subsp. pseudoverticillatus]|uniref:hypothetical protein n=1 Tax=Streptomyces rimosus TaxID=1927 RepID=UPI0006B266CE|nr:hypothetical protein [Streptomyces rimosus]KOT80906.1 hypothetical protein ADK70_26995 [Streptomyces rimosus subsp. pseudoverticillatus]
MVDQLVDHDEPVAFTGAPAPRTSRTGSSTPTACASTSRLRRTAASSACAEAREPAGRKLKKQLLQQDNDACG